MSGKGMMIAVVGPSGAGKDSLMNLARRHFGTSDQVQFVRRTITRSPDGETEDHDSVTPSQFAAMESAGMFAVWWQAHGLNYGIPASTISELDAGKTLVANGSRGAISAFQQAYPHLAVVNITARPEIIAERLHARGRESAAEISLRLTRQTEDTMTGCHVVTIDNSDSLDRAAADFIRAIEGMAGLANLPTSI